MYEKKIMLTKTSERFLCINSNENYYVYDCYRNSIWAIPKSVFNKLDGNKYVEYEEKTDEGFLFKLINKKKPNILEYSSKQANVSICYSHFCNLNCSYCFAQKNDKKMSFEEIKRVIDYIEEEYFPDAVGYSFSLGYTNESFFDIELLKKIYDYLMTLQSYEFKEKDFIYDNIDDLIKEIPKDILIKYTLDEKQTSLELLNNIVRQENLNKYFNVSEELIYWEFRQYLHNFSSIDEFHKVLINRKILERVWCDDIIESKPKYQSISFMTNGTYVTEEHINILKKMNKTSIWISIDGPKEIHDFSRKDKCGKGTFDIVYNNIQKLITNNISVNAAAVLIPEYPNILEIITFFRKIGIREVSFHLVRNIKKQCFTDDSLRKLLKEFDTLYTEIYKQIQKNDYSLVLMLKNTIIVDTLLKIYKKERVIKRCNWGDEAVVDENGDVYRCLYLLGSRENNLGRLTNGIKKDDLKDNVNVDTVHKCSICWARYLCGGTCYFYSIKKYNDKFSVDEIECKFRKSLIEKSIRLYVSLYESNLLKSVIKQIT